MINMEDRYEYDAFGKPYSGDLSGAMNLGYTGKPYDTATGLYNYGYRDYSPEAARFTKVDPIRDGNNWFAYVNNDPVNYIVFADMGPKQTGNDTSLEPPVKRDPFTSFLAKIFKINPSGGIGTGNKNK